MNVRDTGRDLWRTAVAGMLFPAHERLKRHETVARLRELERTQWLSREEIDALRVERLQAFLRRAGERVPYYQDLFRTLDFRPGALCSIVDLARLPLLDKPKIRSLAGALRARNARRLRPFNTSGSTGEPLVFQLSPERVSHDVAAKWRATRWWGVDIGDPEAVLWGSPVELGAQDRLRTARDRVFRTRLFPAFAMSQSNMDGYLDAIRKMRPRMLFGYPSALQLLAKRATAQRQDMIDLGIRVAFVTGERLYDEQRRDIAEVFGCRVANGYGGRDAGFIAHECPAGGMHLSAEDIIVETVDPKGRPTAPGKPGELVVTHLATADFPFIRYRTGDVSVLEGRSCACGRGLPLLGEIQGRATDFVTAADGTVMHGLALIYTVREQPEVAQFKIIQESLKRTRVLIVPGAAFGPAVAERIRNGLRQRLGVDVEISVEQVNQVPTELSGKYRYVVSHVGPGRGGVTQRGAT
ncbi:MAG: AMP-binding protein [Nitrococcus sp.]|nr:AMP-binding protein [Nitrococcus sp.]